MVHFLKQRDDYINEKAKAVIPAERLWVNPGCGLKTRGWEKTKKALGEMVNAAKELRQRVGVMSK
ncbi:hypothetical protein [Terrimonas alba]|uniref:hypothetical protein n=1 Tax=Terrimonas alba TaxID=3349636 RepID=UPI0035F2B8C9